MRVTSEAFADGDRIPARYEAEKAGGDNVSPPLSWTGASETAASYAVTCVDRSPVAGDFVHWAVVDLPPGTTSLPEGASGRLDAGRELTGTSGRKGWSGPSPPAGTGAHPYVFTVYALSVPSLDLPDRVDAEDISRAVEGRVVASGTLTGESGR